MILQITVIKIIPISIGMLIHKFKINFSKRLEKPMRIASAAIFASVLLAMLASNFDIIGKAIREVELFTLLLNLITLNFGYLTARLFKLNFKSAVSITLESGKQNRTLAFVIATSILDNAEIGIPTRAYAIWIFITGGILMCIRGKRI